jgi:ProP effector
MPDSTKQRKVKAARDVIAVLADLWPNCFAVFERRRRPLKLVIHRDVLVAAKGAIGSLELANALRRYCGNPGYLRSCVEGAPRIDLDGAPAGRVTADEAAFAAERLAQYAARRPAKPRLAPKPVARDKPPDSVRRAGFADLKAMSRARRERGAA